MTKLLTALAAAEPILRNLYRIGILLAALAVWHELHDGLSVSGTIETTQQ